MNESHCIVLNFHVAVRLLFKFYKIKCTTSFLVSNLSGLKELCHGVFIHFSDLTRLFSH